MTLISFAHKTSNSTFYIMFFQGTFQSHTRVFRIVELFNNNLLLQAVEAINIRILGIVPCVTGIPSNVSWFW